MGEFNISFAQFAEVEQTLWSPFLDELSARLYLKPTTLSELNASLSLYHIGERELRIHQVIPESVRSINNGERFFWQATLVLRDPSDRRDTGIKLGKAEFFSDTDPQLPDSGLEIAPKSNLPDSRLPRNARR